MNTPKSVEIIKERVEPAFEDERGKIYDIVDRENIRHIGLITFTKGSVRGGHYHKEAKQITYVVSGRIELMLRDSKDAGQKKEQTIIMEAGDMVTIPPMIIHSLKSIGDATILVLTDKQRSDNGYENDTHRVQI